MLLERRLQLLLDNDRYGRVAREAERSGRSVAAVIREAIDLRFPGGVNRRQQALATFLEMTELPDAGPAQDWASMKAELAEETDRRLSR